ncbi:MAG: hypothetical protein JSV67_06445 [Thermoplasmatales archaeon]|nr:MAG: hypothetical protein JSV67_06445 [Thermoplasmatales archaeon]
MNKKPIVLGVFLILLMTIISPTTSISKKSSNTLYDAELLIEIINHNTARITFIGCPGKEEATNIEWEMKYTGPFVFLNLKPQNGNITILRDGESIEISYEPKGFMLMLGFGPISFEVTVTEDYFGKITESKVVGFLILFLISWK